MTSWRFTIRWYRQQNLLLIPEETGFRMKIINGWLTGRNIRRIDSPNHDDRPAGEGISLLVIHNISLPPGKFGGCHIDELFTNCLDPRAHPFFASIAGARVSAHVLINRQGQVTQYVPFSQRAWHAGQSTFQGRERCNDFSIGIELEGTDTKPYTRVQYERLVSVTRQILLAYPAIKPENIVGHADIAPGRKTDPGASFDWTRYRNLAGIPV